MKFNKLLLTSVVLLAGCASDSIQREPMVNVVPVTNSATLTIKGSRLTAQQLNGIDQFIVTKGSLYALKVRLIGHSKKGNSQLTRVENRLRKLGLARQQIQISKSESEEGDLKILVESFRAEVPQCNKQKFSVNTFNHYKTHPSFGCANASALAQMVANPKDLIVGEEIGSTNGEKAVSTIEAYINPPQNTSNSNNSNSSQNSNLGGN